MAAASATIVLARHGQTELNRLGVVQGSGVDPGLNAEGQAQARALFARLRDRVGGVVTSGMLRARETARPFADAGHAVTADRRLREICWGEQEGMVATPESREAYLRLTAAWRAGDLDARLPGAESAAELATRLRAAWDDLRAAAAAAATPPLVVMHGRALRCLCAIVEAQPIAAMDDYPHANAGYYVAECRGDAWSLTERNVTSHLPDPVNPAS